MTVVTGDAQHRSGGTTLFHRPRCVSTGWVGAAVLQLTDRVFQLKDQVFHTVSDRLSVLVSSTERPGPSVEGLTDISSVQHRNRSICTTGLLHVSRPPLTTPVFHHPVRHDVPAACARKVRNSATGSAARLSLVVDP